MENRYNEQQPDERSPQDLAVKNPDVWKTGEEERTSAERGTTEHQPQEADRAQEPQRGEASGE